MKLTDNEGPQAPNGIRSPQSQQLGLSAKPRQSNRRVHGRLEAASREEGRTMTVVLLIALGLYLICGRVQIESNSLKTLAYPNRAFVKFTVRTWGLAK
jgi:hypothetical protein